MHTRMRIGLHWAGWLRGYPQCDIFARTHKFHPYSDVKAASVISSALLFLYSSYWPVNGSLRVQK